MADCGLWIVGFDDDDHVACPKSKVERTLQRLPAPGSREVESSFPVSFGSPIQEGLRKKSMVSPFICQDIAFPAHWLCYQERTHPLPQPGHLIHVRN